MMSSNFAPRPTPFGLSLPFDRLRMIGNTNRSNTNPLPFGLSLSKPCDDLRGTPFARLRTHGHFDRLSANGVWGVFHVQKSSIA
jgi:hypothetical protein